MFGRHWLHYIALGAGLAAVLAAIFWFVFVLPSEDVIANYGYETPAGYKGPPAHPESWDGALEGKDVNPKGYQAICNEPSNKDYADLCQQWRMAEYARQQAGTIAKQLRISLFEVGALLFTVLFTGWAAVAASRAAAAAQGSVAVAEKTARRQLRAYVGFEDMYFIYAAGTETHSPTEKFTNWFKTRIRNYGATPARNVTFWFKRSHKPIRKSDFDGAEPEISSQTLQPTQRLGRDFLDNAFPQKTSRFYAAGQIVYQDIYDDWWLCRFSFRYDLKDGATRGALTPDGGMNGENGPYKSEAEALKAQGVLAT